MGCKFNPYCCCIPLQYGVLVISILQMISSVFNILLGLLILVFGMEVLNLVGVNLQALQDFEAIGEANKNCLSGIGKFVYSIVTIVGGIFSFLLDLLLYHGAKQRNSYYCKVWTNFAAAGLIFALIAIALFGFEIYVENMKIWLIIAMIVQLYFILVVCAFREEILRENYERRQNKQKEFVDINCA